MIEALTITTVIGLATLLKQKSSSSTSIQVSAPGKVILFGEHAVVYKKKAIATSLDDLRTSLTLTETKGNNTVSIHAPKVNLFNVSVPLYELNGFNGNDGTVEKNVFDKLTEIANRYISSDSNSKIVSLIAFLYLYIQLRGDKLDSSIHIELDTNLPIGAGLGSSASFSVCLAGGLLKYFGYNTKDKQLINKWAYFCEELIHGTPSGIDNTVATYGGVVSFIKGEAPQTIDNIPGNIKILIVDTGVPRDTKALVAGVRQRLEQDPDNYNQYMNSIEQISNDCLNLFSSYKTLTDQEYRKQLSSLIDSNQELLRKIGVSHDSLENVISIATQYNLHCKLTGAGGGGCAYVLLGTDESNNTKFKEHLSRVNLKFYESSVGHEGVIIN
jgi:mevalonate kinase